MSKYKIIIVLLFILRGRFMTDFEKLGAFYLGKVFDRRRDAVTDDLLLYDSKDLTTHAVVVGMTGSGKTGLCLDILEEAALQSIPALIHLLLPILRV